MPPRSLKHPLSLETFFQTVRPYLTKHYGKDGPRLWISGQGIVDLEQRALFYTKVIEDTESLKSGKTMSAVSSLALYRTPPVDVRTFCCDEAFLNKASYLYPLVLDEIGEMNSGKYIEIILTGGIGSAKTTAALYSTAYQQYLLSCMYNAHAAFGLDPSSEILTVFQSITATVSANSFRRFRDMVTQSKYFKNHFPWDKDLKTKLVFPNRIEVTPISGQETAAIGQNVIGGMIDELNYMSVVTQSKKSVDQGNYDQAVALYNSIARRRESRYTKVGRQLPGLLCLVSSKRYPGQFTDRKEEERADQIRKEGSSTIYLYDKRVWEVKPPNSFSSEMFHVFAGDLARRPRILLPNETVPDVDRHLVVAIPVNFRHHFDGPGADIINALREIAGVSTLARHPFFVNVEAVDRAFGKHASIFSRDSVDFVDTKLAIFPNRFFKPSLPRWAHVDLAISGDSAGLTIGTVTGFVGIAGTSGEITNEMMPIVHIDGSIEIRPPRNGEILFYKIREVLDKLRKLGMNIRWVSYDSFQSRDSLQILKQQGFVAGLLSVDVTPIPYDFLKSAIYTGRLSMPEHAKCRVEMLSLENDTKTGKIDHPANGSKDVSDSLAGVVYGLTNRREIWGMYKVPLVRVPNSIRAEIGPEHQAETSDGKYTRVKAMVKQKVAA